MQRPALDQFIAAHRLSAPAVDAALRLTGARPGAHAWRVFAARATQAAGLAALGAGLLCFVAANWQAWGLMGRFGLIEAGLLLCIAGALWRMPPHPLGQAALLLATLFTGGLLALFGQSYQTGADVYELFLTWAVLTLPFALADCSGTVWALWWTVLNIGLALLCGTLVKHDVVWQLFFGAPWSGTTLLVSLSLVNLLAAGAFLWLRGTRFASAAPLWLPRGLATLATVYGSAAAVTAIDSLSSGRGSAGHGGAGLAALLLYAVVSLAIAITTWQRRRDVFATTLLAGSWIAVTTYWIAHSMHTDLGALFLIALWLIGTSTVAGMVLMRCWRDWRPSLDTEVRP